MNTDPPGNETVPENSRESIGKSSEGDSSIGVQGLQNPEMLPEIAERIRRLEGKDFYGSRLPSASEIAKYEETSPGAAERVISMAEKALEQRIHAENEKFGLTRHRLTASTLTSLAVLAVAVLAIVLGPAWIALPLGIMPFLVAAVRELMKKTNKG